MDLRWGVDGPTVRFEAWGHPGQYRAEIGSLIVYIAPGHSAETRIGRHDFFCTGGCQQTALDRLHTKLGEFSARIDEARAWRP
jgi:hypothetical protein